MDFNLKAMVQEHWFVKIPLSLQVSLKKIPLLPVGMCDYNSNADDSDGRTRVGDVQQYLPKTTGL